MKIEPRHDFSNHDWKEKYTRRPSQKNEPRISSGPARSNFTNHKGSFGGNKTWSVSVMASVVSGVKDKGRAAAFAEYIERPEECLSAVGDPEAKKKFNELEKKLLSDNPKRVIQRRLIVPVPIEFLNNPDKLMKKFADQFGKKYFEPCSTYNFALHAGGKDLKNPHIHIIFSPVDAAGKNIRDLSKSNYMFLDSFKRDVGQFLHNELGVEIRTIDKKQARKRYPRWVSEAAKRAEKAELAGDKGALKREYMQRYPIFGEFLQEKERKKALKEYSELKNEEKKFNEKFKDFAEKTKKVFDKITGSEEAEIKNKVKEIREGKEGKDNMCWEKKQKNQEPTKEPAKKEEKPKEKDKKSEIKKEINELQRHIDKLDKKINSKFISNKKREKLIIESNDISIRKYKLESELQKLETPKPEPKPKIEIPKPDENKKYSDELQKMQQHQVSQEFIKKNNNENKLRR